MSQPPNPTPLSALTTTPVGRAVIALVLGLIPALPLILVIEAYTLPEGTPLVDLAGTWAVTVLENPHKESVGCTQARLPGKFFEQHCSAARNVFERTFEIPPALVGAPLMLWMGGTGSGTVEVMVNGTPVGSYGDPYTGDKPSLTDEISFFLPTQLLRAGAINTITLDTRWWTPSHSIMRRHDGLVSPRLVLGAQQTLGPVFAHQDGLGVALRHGAALVLLFAAWLLGALLAMERGQAQRATYLRALALVVATVLYLTPLNGSFFSLLPTQWRAETLPFSVSLFLLAAMEFVEDHYLGRVTVLRRGHRVLMGAMLLVWLVTLVAGLGDVIPIYDVIITYAILMALYVSILALRGLLQDTSGMAPLLGMALVVMAVAGVLTALDELGVWKLPFFFDLAMANIPICATVVVLSDFVQLSLRNRDLSSSLSDANTALRKTLVAAEEANRVKGEFLATISHEFRTPLNPIINLPDILAEQFEQVPTLTCPSCADVFAQDANMDPQTRIRCPSCGQSSQMTPGTTWQFVGDGPEARRHLERVKENGLILLTLVDRAMELSNLSRAESPSAHAVVSARGLMQGVLVATQEAAAAARVRVELRGGEDASVETNAQKMRLALLQLVDNAIKFSRPGGVVELAVEANADHVLFSVRDHGEGIAASDLGIIFEAFRQADGSHTRRHGGTGLGLTLAKGMVEAHGGSITVESQRGEGSCFTVRLPRQDGGAGSTS